jgi:hypothetical protein
MRRREFTTIFGGPTLAGAHILRAVAQQTDRDAIAAAKQAVKYSDNANNRYQHGLRRLDLANALLAGEAGRAAALFAEVESILRKRQTKYNWLVSLHNFSVRRITPGAGQIGGKNAAATYSILLRDIWVRAWAWSISALVGC